MTPSTKKPWHNLGLEFHLSDTYGGREVNPTAPNTPDIDVLLEKNLSRLAWILKHASPEKIATTRIEREYSIQGRGIPVGQHIARIANQWTQEYGDLLKEHNLEIGLFINAAPRIGRRVPEDFHIAENNNGLRIVAPKEALQFLRNDIRRLSLIPNLNSGIWQDRSQHRSKDAHNALVCENGINVQDAEWDELPLADFLKLKVRYVDVHGNLITYAGSSSQNRLISQLIRTANFQDNKNSRAIKIQIGNTVLAGDATNGLEDSTEGIISAYSNNGNIDIIRKYDTGKKGAKESAYALFNQPVEGESEVHIDFL